MELRRYWFFLRRWFWLVGLVTLVAGGASYLLSKASTPIYSATATVLVDQAQNPVNPDYSSVLASQQITRTYSQLIKTRPVLARAIADLKLSLSPDDLGKIVNVVVIRDTQLLALTVEDSNPALARDLANTLARDFIALTQQDKQGQSATTATVLQDQLKALEGQMRETSTALDQARTSGGSQSAAAMQLQAVLSQQQATYSQILHSLDQAQLDQARITDQLRIVEPAILPTEPVRPRIALNVLLGAALGLILGVGFALLLEYLDDTVKSPEIVESLTGFSALGTITRIPRVGDHRGLLGEESSHSPVGEAYRILRTNVDFARVGRTGKTLLVTSTSAGEGKTTTAANLAVVNAQAGRRVVLVDADLRRPSVHRVFDVDNVAGLTNLLLEDAPSASSALQPTDWPNLWVLPSGPIPPNPAELLGSYRMERVLDRLADEADLVIVDSPPVLAVADPTILAARATGVILVVEAGRTRAEALTRAKEHLTRGSSHVLGVVLNKLATGMAAYQYYAYEYKGERATGKAREAATSTRATGGRSLAIWRRGAHRG